jgi:MraZ protein
MVQGQQQAKVGDKFRIAFPSSYREAMGETLILTYGFERSLIATTEKNWNEVLAREVDTKSFLDAQTRDLRRFFLGGVTTVEFDTQGRFVVPEYLRNYAEISVGNGVVFVWQREYIEIWNVRHWEEKQKSILENISTIAQKLSRTEAQK